MQLAAFITALALVADAPPRERLEYSVVPAATYNLDDGLGLALLGVIAGFEPGYNPYRWRGEVLSFVTLREDTDGHLELPSQVHWLLLDFPGAIGGDIRLKVQVGYAQLNRFYRGLGNRGKTRGEGRDVQFVRTGFPTELTVRARVAKNLYLLAIAQFTYNFITVFDDSLLQDERDSLAGTGEHALLIGKLGLEWDTRNHELVPTSGMFYELLLQEGRGFVESFDYGAVSATARMYQALAGRYLVVAARIMADFYFRKPAFYELPAIGDAFTIRGVPAGLYRGKLRVLANLELRSRFLRFSTGGHRFHLGAAAFMDTGRVWAEYEENIEKDGEGAGLKFGTGGGLRFQWGETVMIRLDGAWSPDGTGIYLDINQAF